LKAQRMAAKKKAAKKTTKRTITDAAKKKAALRAFMGRINTPERKIIGFADEAPSPHVLRRPSGIMKLDLQTGGGLPAGGLSCIGGPDNAGKSYLLLKYFAMHQMLYGENSYICICLTEGSFDFEAAMLAGMKVAVPDEMIMQWQEERILRGEQAFTKEELRGFKEQIGTVIIIQGLHGEESLQAVLDAIESRLFGIVAIDSVTALRSKADADKDLDEHEKRAARAGLLTRFLLRYWPTTNTLNELNFTSLIMTHQVRANQERANAAPFMQKFIKTWQVSGANATKHAKLIDIIVRTGSKLKKKVQKKDMVIGKTMKWEIAKGKQGCHDNLFGEAPFLYPEYGPFGVNVPESVLMEGLKRGVITEGAGGVVQVFEGSEFAQTFPTLPRLQAVMEIDFELELRLRRHILNAVEIRCLYR